MTQYGLRSQEKLCRSLRTSKSSRTTNCASGDHVGDDLNEAKEETAETKGELSRENVHDILQGMQDLRGWPAVGAHSGRVARRTPTGNARKAMRGGLASVGDLAKSKTKEKARPSTASAFAAAFVVFDRSAGSSRQANQKATVKLAGQQQKQ